MVTEWMSSSQIIHYANFMGHVSFSIWLSLNSLNSLLMYISVNTSLLVTAERRVARWLIGTFGQGLNLQAEINGRIYPIGGKRHSTSYCWSRGITYRNSNFVLRFKPIPNFERQLTYMQLINDVKMSLVSMSGTSLAHDVNLNLSYVQWLLCTGTSLCAAYAIYTRFICRTYYILKLGYSAYSSNKILNFLWKLMSFVHFWACHLLWCGYFLRRLNHSCNGHTASDEAVVGSMHSNHGMLCSVGHLVVPLLLSVIDLTNIWIWVFGKYSL